MKSTLPKVGQNAWNFIRAGVGGFLGGFGFLLSLVIVPLYLYYFLTESPKIAESWSHYVPLRLPSSRTRSSAPWQRSMDTSSPSSEGSWW
ncbi:hypothetical protein [Verrucomicrobium spinosum]|uniref:hypothetical protein n=1 Tax=Verrucomicrobium spinosum TaxID=2736 RepID=UPI000946610E|nr:hypothetical protein [Verrucomicrobium spinosum]